jgi:hypothetical protein
MIDFKDLINNLNEAHNEKDVENIYRALFISKIPKCVIRSPYNTDGIICTERINCLLEFKYKQQLTKEKDRNKVIIQCIFYLKSLENDPQFIESPITSIFIGDTDEYITMDSYDLLPVLKFTNVDWTISASKSKEYSFPEIENYINKLEFKINPIDNFDINHILDDLQYFNLARFVRSDYENMVETSVNSEKNKLEQKYKKDCKVYEEKLNKDLKLVMNHNIDVEKRRLEKEYHTEIENFKRSFKKELIEDDIKNELSTRTTDINNYYEDKFKQYKNGFNKIQIENEIEYVLNSRVKIAEDNINRFYKSEQEKMKNDYTTSYNKHIDVIRNNYENKFTTWRINYEKSYNKYIDELASNYENSYNNHIEKLNSDYQEYGHNLELEFENYKITYQNNMNNEYKYNIFKHIFLTISFILMLCTIFYFGFYIQP